MYSTIITLLFFAFLLLYNLSRKNKWENKPSWAKDLASRKLLSRSVSFALMGISCMLLMYAAGTGSGIFAFIVILMGMGCLIVLLSPFRYVAAKHLVALYAVSLIFEHFIF